MLANGNYLPNPNQQLGGSFSQALQSGTGPWGNTVATPTDSSMPTGQDVDQSLSALAANIPGTSTGNTGPNSMPAGAPTDLASAMALVGGGKGPLATIAQATGAPTAATASPGLAGMAGYSQLLEQQASQLPALQQQQSSNRAALMQAYNNLAQQQANYKPPSQINVPLMAMAAAGAENPANPLGPSLAAYAGAANQQAQQERTQNNQNIDTQMKIAALPVQFSDEDVKNAMDAAKEGLTADKTQQTLLMQMNNERIKQGLPPITSLYSPTATTPLGNGMAQDENGLLLNSQGQRITPTGNALSPAEIKDSLKQVDQMTKNEDLAKTDSLVDAANTLTTIAKQNPNLNPYSYSVSGFNSKLPGANNAVSPLLDYLTPGSVLTPEDLARYNSAADIVNSAAFQGSKNIRNLFEFRTTIGGTDVKGMAAAATADIANSAAARYQLSQTENQFLKDYQAKYNTLQGFDELFQKYVKDTSPAIKDSTGKVIGVNQDALSPATYTKYVDNAPIIYRAVKNNVSAPAAAILDLTQNPNLSSDFDEKYGAQSSTKILGSQ